MTLADDKTIEETMARMRDRADQFAVWIEHLRSDDPAFAEASTLCRDDTGEWPAAVYFLTSCDQVWTALAGGVFAQRAIAPATSELEKPRRAWSSGEDAVMQWASHFWDVDRRPAKFHYAFEEFYFRRWITACHLYKQIPPSLMIADRRRVA